MNTALLLLLLLLLLQLWEVLKYFNCAILSFRWGGKTTTSSGCPFWRSQDNYTEFDKVPKGGNPFKTCVQVLDGGGG